MDVSLLIFEERYVFSLMMTHRVKTCSQYSYSRVVKFTYTAGRVDTWVGRCSVFL